MRNPIWAVQYQDSDSPGVWRSVALFSSQQSANEYRLMMPVAGPVTWRVEPLTVYDSPSEISQESDLAVA